MWMPPSTGKCKGLLCGDMVWVMTNPRLCYGKSNIVCRFCWSDSIVSNQITGQSTTTVVVVFRCGNCANIFITTNRAATHFSHGTAKYLAHHWLSLQAFAVFDHRSTVGEPCRGETLFGEKRHKTVGTCWKTWSAGRRHHRGSALPSAVTFGGWGWGPKRTPGSPERCEGTAERVGALSMACPGRQMGSLLFCLMFFPLPVFNQIPLAILSMLPLFQCSLGPQNPLSSLLGLEQRLRAASCLRGHGDDVEISIHTISSRGQSHILDSVTRLVAGCISRYISTGEH